MRSTKSGTNLLQIWQVFGPWASPYGANDQCTTTGLDNSTGLRTEKIRQAVTEIWVPQVWPVARPPARTVITIPLQPGGLRGKKHWYLLHHSELCKELFPEPPILAFRKAPNLSNLLVRAKLPNTTPKPQLKPQTCETDNCQDCQIIRSRTEIADRKGGNINWPKIHAAKQRM